VSDALRGIAALSSIPGNGRYAPPTVLGPASNLSCSFQCKHIVIGGTPMQLVVPLLAETLIFSRLTMPRYILREKMVVIFPQGKKWEPYLQPSRNVSFKNKFCNTRKHFIVIVLYLFIKMKKRVMHWKKSQFPKQPTITATRQKVSCTGPALVSESPCSLLLPE
jgi:hypothetical protein